MKTARTERRKRITRNRAPGSVTMISVIDGHADFAAAALLAEHGILGDIQDEMTWPLADAVTRLVNEIGGRAKGTDVSDFEPADVMVWAYCLGVAVGRRLGPQGLIPKGGAR